MRQLNYLLGERTDGETGLYCTSRSCLRGTRRFYRVIDQNGSQIDFGLCLICAGILLEQLPDGSSITTDTDAYVPPLEVTQVVS